MASGGVTNAQGVSAINSLSGSGGGIGLSAVGVLAQQGAPLSVTGTLVETTLLTVAIPAKAVGPNGVIRVAMSTALTSNGDTKTVSAYLGGQKLFASAASGISGQDIQFRIAANGTNAQTGNWAATSNMGLGSSSTRLTSAVDMTVAQNLTITGLLASAGDTITLLDYTVELLNP
jgi:hypothetical protein